LNVCVDVLIFTKCNTLINVSPQVTILANSALRYPRTKNECSLLTCNNQCAFHRKRLLVCEAFVCLLPQCTESVVARSLLAMVDNIVCIQCKLAAVSQSNFLSVHFLPLRNIHEIYGCHKTPNLQNSMWLFIFFPQITTA